MKRMLEVPRGFFWRVVDSGDLATPVRTACSLATMRSYALDVADWHDKPVECFLRDADDMPGTKVLTIYPQQMLLNDLHLDAPNGAMNW